MNTLNRLSVICTRFFEKILIFSIHVFTKALNKMKKPQWWEVSQFMEADDISLIQQQEYPDIKQKKVTIECETRNALLMSVPATFEHKIRISKGAFLEFGIGVVKDSHMSFGQKVSFKIFFENMDGKNLIFSKKMHPHFPENKHWLDVKIDLSEYEGQKGRFIFKAKDNSKKYDTKVAWSNLILSRKKEKDINIILISLDSLRPDHLNCYGYCRETSPCIDALAKEGVLFENAISQSHWTLPAHMSMLTSLYSSTHKVYIERKLEKSKITLAQVLRKHGFKCLGFVTHTRLRPEYGFARGFDSYIYKEYDFQAKRATAEEVTLKAMNFISENKHKNMFIFLHYFDIHAPYTPPGRYATLFDTTYTGNITGRDFRLFTKPVDNIFADSNCEISEHDLAHITALYDGEIAHVDYFVGMLLNHLKATGIYENTLIILTSDHGEELWEHKSIGHNNLYDEVVRVPLIIKLPRKMEQKRIDQVVQGNIDIFPTALDVLGIPSPRHVQGNSLLPLIETPSKKWSNEAYSERLSGWNSNEYGIAVRTRRYKYIYTTRFDIHDFTSFQKHDEIKELYDIAVDPHETKNIVNTEGELAKSFQEKVDAFISHNLRIYNLDEKEKINEKIRKLKILNKL